MNVTQELKILRLGQPPEMRFKTGESEAPVFVLRVLTSAEELEATINTQRFLEDNPDLPAHLYQFINETEKLAIALKDGDGRRFFNNGTEFRARFIEEEVGHLLASYKGLLLHYKTLDTISDEDLKALIDGVAAGKLLESI
ncbi:hypothetical protein [Brevibacillus centrosporus]|uniref:hypothetical protein n=1 Tax=Brevibacillus centrosporus TaxID=54910 RepID=UPI002E1DBBD5|nr:hypothetical protein [Brevibacillus centrosporus]